MKDNKMKMLGWRLAGVGLLVMVGSSLVAPSLPVQAQEQSDRVQLVVTPTTVAPGEVVTVTPEEQPGTSCVPNTAVSWQLVDPDVPSGEPSLVVDSGTAPTVSNGSWEVQITAPSDAGVFEVHVYCITHGQGPIFDSATFEVVAPTTTTSPPTTSGTPATTAPAARPARPVSGQPDFTG
jgi:hypothetical protein